VSRPRGHGRLRTRATEYGLLTIVVALVAVAARASVFERLL